MFVCEPCHEKTKCKICQILGWFSMSYGKCESCGKSAGCFDCHSY